MTRRASLGQVWRSRGVILRLAQVQLRDRYSGSVLGAAWALAQPALLMAVYWFVFVHGLRIASPPGQVPFVWMLLTGLAPWFYVNDSVGGGIQAVSGSAYLVRKIAFPLEILPLAPLAGSVMVHAALLVLIGAVLAFAGEFAGWRVLLLPLYVLSVSVLVAGLAYWLAALQVFHRDVAQTATLVLQVWFWMTPIVWSFAALSPATEAVLRWNPLVFVVEGYRYCLLGGVTAAPDAVSTACFWLVAAAALGSGLFFYRRLQGEFADVL